MRKEVFIAGSIRSMLLLTPAIKFPWKKYLAALTLSACTLMYSSALSASKSSPTCELMYSAHPHQRAIAAVGAERLALVQTLDVQETGIYSNAFLAMTREMAKTTTSNSQGKLEFLGQDLVLGGYAGVSTTTAVIRTAIHGPSGYQALLRLAARIGYVYAQDSTLVICDGQAPANWRSVVSLEISDAGNEAFLSEENAIRFYGLIVGAFNGPDNIGYTYYPGSKVFSTLAGLSRGKEGRSIVEELANWLSTLSNGDVQFKFDERPVWIFYPHNNWKEYPEGGAYSAHLTDQNIDPGLHQRRAQFLKTFDDYFIQHK